MCTAAYKRIDDKSQEEHVRLGEMNFLREKVSKDQGRSNDVFSKLLQR